MSVSFSWCVCMFLDNWKRNFDCYKSQSAVWQKSCINGCKLFSCLIQNIANAKEWNLKGLTNCVLQNFTKGRNYSKQIRGNKTQHPTFTYYTHKSLYATLTPSALQICSSTIIHHVITASQLLNDLVLMLKAFFSHRQSCETGVSVILPSRALFL